MKILTAISGGVDSGVAALLLKEQGHEVAGITMRWWQPGPGGHASLDSITEDARRVCDALSIPQKTVDCQQLFAHAVIKPFADSYLAGLTPNPCIWCNRHLKFGLLLDIARAEGYDALATGHYARIEQRNGHFYLHKAAQQEKDQSYVLYQLNQSTLPFVRFPLEGMDKTQIRHIAQKAALPVSHKPDSQEICFIADGDYAGFITRQPGFSPCPGDIVDQTGKVHGKHEGIWRYTIGQRKGLGGHWGMPVYVTAIDARTNTVTVGCQEALMKTRCMAGAVSFVAGHPPEKPDIQAKIRYSAPPADAVLTPKTDGVWEVRFQSPQRAITPGQAVVFYDGDIVLGGGTILTERR